MSLTPGTRLGVYEILAAIGAGGMGEVYRARDRKLERDVAIKILPEAVAADPERIARFEREAKTLAALNHPNIAHIHGLEESDGIRALVMELVEGPTLADRIAQGPIPIDEALPIAKQIAEALEAAHDQGIVHRDLKPANVKVRPDGTVKVLDFGLAKALEPAGSASQNTALSPTITSPAAMTRIGIVLGTAAYMAPEQARGKPVDKRADIWAFGCLLYEMLTGERAFGGDEVSDTLAFVITKEVSWRLLPADTPASIQRMLRRCLEKDRVRRLADIHDVRLEIDDAATAEVGDLTARSSPTGAVSQGSVLRAALPWAISSVLGLALLAVVFAWAPWRKASSSPPIRLNAELGADVSLVVTAGDTALLSPDGTVLAFVAAVRGGPWQIYVRRLHQSQAVLLSGTTNARGIFFSPNSQWMGFFADGKLKKVALTGGAVITLCAAPEDRGGAWLDDGTIVFVPNASLGTGLQRVTDAGGTPEQLAAVPRDEVARFPHMLPGGKGLLYTGSTTSTGGYDDANIVVQPLPSGARKVVQRGGYDGRYLPSGHLVYVHAGTLFAAPFDLARQEVTGSPVPVLESIVASPVAGSALYSSSDTGTLVYLQGQSVGADAPIVWMDRQGKTSSLRSASSSWSNPHFAPNGRLLALDIFDGKQTDIWVYDWARETLSRFTSDPSDDLKPVWTPDGSRIVFSSTRNNSRGLYWQRSDGTGEVQRLTESITPQLPGSWHPNGKLLAFSENNAETNFDIKVLPLEGDEASGWKPGKATVFLNTPFNEQEPMFSPDGRWIAYMSNETGQNEVFVRPFPGPGGKLEISAGGGAFPTWSRTRPELLYQVQAGRQQVMVARYSTEGDSFRAEKPVLWSEARIGFRPRGRWFDLHPDGERLAVAAESDSQATTKVDHLQFVFNFFSELRRLAPPER